MPPAPLLLPLLALAFAGQAAPVPSAGSDRPAQSTSPGREADARVAAIAFRLAAAGRARCPRTEPGIGIVLQHLSQFMPADRPGMVAALGLDRGPGVIVVVPGSPAAAAGLRAGDVLLAVGGAPLPAEGVGDAPFASARAHDRADQVHALIAQAAAAGPFAVTLWRSGETIATTIAPRPVCASRVHLARSEQRNAYADGAHVFMTTGLLSRLRSDDELAFVLAHEMAHNALGHAAIMRGGQVRQGIGRTLGRSGAIVRETERAADLLGGELMLDAGFDPVAGAAILPRLGGDGLGIAFLAAHAPAGERIAAMEALVRARRGR